MPMLRTGDRDVVEYDDRGAGRLIVLVHGSPGTSRAWQTVGERLASRFRVVAPNLPGAGGSTRRADETRTDNSPAAEAVEAVIAEVGPPAVVAGHSHGGVVALMTALRGKGRPAALALFEPVAVPILGLVGDTAAFASAKTRFDEYIAAFEAGDRLAARLMIDYWFGAGAFERLPGPTRDFFVGQTEPNVRDVRATFRDSSSIDALRALAMPVLVVYGSRSPETTGRIARAVAAQCPRGETTVLEKADHAMTTTHPNAVAALIADLADRSG
ncbi:MAG TPA: alpha/beta hydrolase [Methylomirabilota bacterium]|nr:alpha/beta hydrolase [Methylomirabilota bacterium]